jgi:hypothetical protein
VIALVCVARLKISISRVFSDPPRCKRNECIGRNNPNHYRMKFNIKKVPSMSNEPVANTKAKAIPVPDKPEKEGR